MKKRLISLSLMLAGCASMQPKLGCERTLVLYPQFARKTQSLVLVDPLAYIATLDVVPFIQTSSDSFSPISATDGHPVALSDPNVLKFTQASPSIDPSKPMIFRRLKGLTNYRIYGKAYNVSNQQISIDDLSYLALAIANDDAPRVEQIPVTVTVPLSFGASTSVKVYVDGAYDNLKGTLYNGQAQVSMAQSSTKDPTFTLTNLQGFTNYQLCLETYQSGILKASSSFLFPVANDAALASANTYITTPPYTVSTLAGSGANGSSDGMGTSAQFSYPYGIAIDAVGNLYVTDSNNARICKITPAGMVSTLAGGYGTGYFDASGTQALFNSPKGIATDASGYLYVADQYNHCIRKISPEGLVSTLAGCGTAGFSDAQGSNARFNQPIGVAVDASGYVYVGDKGNCRIRKITPDGVVSTLAGGYGGWQDGSGSQAAFNSLWCICVDATGNVYVAENGNNDVRKVAPDGTVTTVAGKTKSGYLDDLASVALFAAPESVAVDGAGNLYVADGNNQRIRKVLPTGMVTTIAGGSQNYRDGVGTVAQFSSPYGVALDAAGNVYVTDCNNRRIRKLTR